MNAQRRRSSGRRRRPSGRAGGDRAFGEPLPVQSSRGAGQRWTTAFGPCATTRVARVDPSGENRRSSGAGVFGPSVTIKSPVAMSQTLSQLCLLRVTSVFPSGLKDRAIASGPWQRIRVRSANVSRFHSLIVRSNPHVASVLPSWSELQGLNAWRMCLPDRTPALPGGEIREERKTTRCLGKGRGLSIRRERPSVNRAGRADSGL